MMIKKMLLLVCFACVFVVDGLVMDPLPHFSTHSGSFERTIFNELQDPDVCLGMFGNCIEVDTQNPVPDELKSALYAGFKEMTICTGYRKNVGLELLATFTAKQYLKRAALRTLLGVVQQLGQAVMANNVNDISRIIGFIMSNSGLPWTNALGAQDANVAIGNNFSTPAGFVTLLDNFLRVAGWESRCEDVVALRRIPAAPIAIATTAANRMLLLGQINMLHGALNDCMEALKINIENVAPPTTGTFDPSGSILTRHRVCIGLTALAGNVQHSGVNVNKDLLGRNQLAGANAVTGLVPLANYTFTLDGTLFHEFSHCLRFVEKGTFANYAVNVAAFHSGEEARNLTGQDLTTNTVDSICTLMYDLQKGRVVRFPYNDIPLPNNINFNTDGIHPIPTAGTGIKAIIKSHEISLQP